ncbi:MAG: methylenetetrahydrofolate reductase [Candidatus Syntropharchaeia archaeon]
MEPFSDFMRAISEGKFVYTGELEPHNLSTDISDVIEWAKTLKSIGKIIAANVTDNPQSFSAMSSLAASYIIQKESGLEMIYQLRTADKNRLALASDILAASALGLKNILALTGDHTNLGNTPQAKPVFDLDSAQLVDLIHKMVHEGKDLAGNEVQGPRPRINVGVAGNPNQDPLELEILKLERKVSVGAEFIQTQVVFDVEIALNFLEAVEYLKTPTLIGIFPPRSYGQASFFDAYVSGVTVPKEFMDAFKKFKEIEDKKKRKEKIDEFNIEYFIDFIKEIKKKKSCAGCHIMAVGYPDVIPPIIEGVER